MAVLLTGILFCSAAGPSHAQVLPGQFISQTGANNPLDGEDVGLEGKPAFVDIDNDGDLDLFVGEDSGIIFYYENTGSTSSPIYTQRTGASNPMNGVDVGDEAAPTFADLDNDGDFDLILGEQDGLFNYYENTGSVSSPVFTVQTGGSNPLNGEDVGGWSIPFLVDIDNDSDFDMFVGETNGTILYYENTGSVSAPTFTQQTGASNPFDGIDLGVDVAPAFVDADGDGDYDAFFGEDTGVIYNYENTGSVAAPSFTQRSGADNPFNGVDVGGEATPAFGDLDNDGDPDAIIGDFDGVFEYYQYVVGPGGVVANLALWLKADVGITTSGSDVSTWADQSGNGKNAGTNGVSNLPALSSTNLNYNSIVEFDASNSEALATSSIFGTATYTDVNIFTVTQVSSIASNMILFNEEDGVTRVGTTHYWAGNHEWDAGAFSGDNRLLVSWTESLTTPYVWGYEYESGTPRQAIYRDGSTIGSDATAPAFTLSGTQPFNIGYIATSSSSFNGDIAEIIIYTSSLSDSEQQEIQTYLAIKYGILLSHDYVASDGGYSVERHH